MTLLALTERRGSAITKALAFLDQSRGPVTVASIGVAIGATSDDLKQIRRVVNEIQERSAQLMVVHPERRNIYLPTGHRTGQEQTVYVASWAAAMNIAMHTRREYAIDLEVLCMALLKHLKPASAG